MTWIVEDLAVWPRSSLSPRLSTKYTWKPAHHKNSILKSPSAVIVRLTCDVPLRTLSRMYGVVPEETRFSCWTAYWAACRTESLSRAFWDNSEGAPSRPLRLAVFLVLLRTLGERQKSTDRRRRDEAGRNAIAVCDSTSTTCTVIH